MRIVQMTECFPTREWSWHMKTMLPQVWQFFSSLGLFMSPVSFIYEVYDQFGMVELHSATQFSGQLEMWGFRVLS